MARKKGIIVNGWINLDKPLGMTSTQALGKVRRILNAQKAGHAGTLDPLATGVLPIALGEATKTIPFAQDHIKTYVFTITWGEERATDDAEGDVTATSPVRPSPEQVNAVLPAFLGEIMQTPPRYSAIKIDGERAYDLARAGEDVEIQPRAVYIDSLDLIDSTPDTATFRCVCEKGTYMRSLARDIPRMLGACGYISYLRREAVGPFAEATAISLDKLAEIADSAAPEDVVLPVETVLDDIPALALNEQEAARLKNGQRLSFIARPDYDRLIQAGIQVKPGYAVTVLATCGGRAVALVDVEGPDIQPVRVLNI